MSKTIYAILVTSGVANDRKTFDTSISQVAYNSEEDAMKFIKNRCSGEHDMVHSTGWHGIHTAEKITDRWYDYRIKPVEVEG